MFAGTGYGFYQEILLARKAELVLGRGKVLGWDVVGQIVFRIRCI
jgi:hypothetical protein